jgi:hypothetical protein
MDADYKHWYAKGWRYSVSPTATLDHLDAIRAPDAMYDGYLDRAAGREKWHLPNCHGCAEHPTRA